MNRKERRRYAKEHNLQWNYTVRISKKQAEESRKDIPIYKTNQYILSLKKRCKDLEEIKKKKMEKINNDNS